MKKLIYITNTLSIAFLIAAWGASAHAKEATEAPQIQSEEPLFETIKGEVKEKLEIQKRPPAIELNVGEIVESGTAQTDNVLQQAKPIPNSADFEHYAYLNSNQVIRPWMPLIAEPPLVTFYPGLSKVASKRWEFRVSDEKGEIVKTIKGKGVPPRQIQWDGLNEHGEYISVGTLYSYQFLTYDDNGNISTFPGEPFQLDALLIREQGKTVIEFANSKLFVQEQASFRPTMSTLWERALDVIRENSNKPLKVEIHAESARSPLAEERRQMIVNSISDATYLPAPDIRHSVEKARERGEITRLIMSVR